MTLTQTYRLAHRARGKLSHEASQGDHDLRLLVGHANLLDNLMIDLQDAEREQDAWFEQSVAVASKPSEPKKVSFAPSVHTQEFTLDVPDASDEEEDADSDSDYEDDRKPARLAVPQQSSRRTRAVSPPAKPIDFSYDDDEAMADDDDESDNLELALTRTRSHSFEDVDMALPELTHESDSSDESDEESQSPPADLAKYQVSAQDFSQQAQREQHKLDEQAVLEAIEEEDFYAAPTMTAPMIACN